MWERPAGHTTHRAQLRVGRERGGEGERQAIERQVTSPSTRTWTRRCSKCCSSSSKSAGFLRRTAMPSGDTTPCRMTGVTLHSHILVGDMTVLSHSGHPTRGYIPRCQTLPPARMAGPIRRSRASRLVATFFFLCNAPKAFRNVLNSPTYLSTYLPTSCLPTYPSTYPPPTYLPTTA